ncbi:hypothetical protein E3N88_15114 [Mikania micrantha]|uniref:PB1 domain-containing protein n=1 Tax=Mikania micrantha TaxID=192012 RepID=A0A5N6NUQ0_9ASTR|nr:hypothetical protein E3N88_15114 [Mikania micrantha]
MKVVEELHQMNSGCSKSPDPSNSEGSQTDTILLNLLKRSPTPLHYKKAGNQLNTIQDKIKSVFSYIADPYEFCIGEFWAPVTINERRVLSTSGQPFFINEHELTMEMVMYRLHSEKHQYDIDVNKMEIEVDPNIRSGGPAIAFLRRLSNVDHLPESESCLGLLDFYITLPICFPSDQSDCIGVLGLTFRRKSHRMEWFFVPDVPELLKAIKKSDVFKYFEIEKQTINGLRHIKDKITHALEIVCKLHNLDLCQVWCDFEDKSHVPLSTYLEDTQRKFGLKLTGYHRIVYHHKEFYDLESYNSLCDVLPLKRTSEGHVMSTLQDFKPRYISEIHDDSLLLATWEALDDRCCAFAICLRSLETGDFNYLFEFIWSKYLEDSICGVVLEAILLTIKRCSPSFKFASGAEIGDDLEVVEVNCSKEGQNTSFKIFQGKQPIVTNNIMAPFKVNQKTAKIFLTGEVIEKQFGKTMNEAADNLKENEDDMIKFHLPVSQATFAIVKKTIDEKFKLCDRTFKLKYLDEDGDWILLTSDVEMNDCIHSLRKSDRILVRLVCYQPKNHWTTSATSGLRAPKKCAITCSSSSPTPHRILSLSKAAIRSSTDELRWDKLW